MLRVRVAIRGYVQGVFFRDGISRRAEKEGVAGRAENRPDGSVECVFEGGREGVERLLDFCRTGPSGARVESVDVVEEEPRGENGFLVR